MKEHPSGCLYESKFNLTLSWTFSDIYNIKYRLWVLMKGLRKTPKWPKVVRVHRQQFQPRPQGLIYFAWWHYYYWFAGWEFFCLLIYFSGRSWNSFPLHKIYSSNFLEHKYSFFHSLENFFHFWLKALSFNYNLPPSIS